YAVENWGARTQLVGVPLGERDYLDRPVKRREDWATIGPLDVTQGALGRQLETVRLLRAELGPDVPLLMTVFNPLNVARMLAGNDLFMAQLRLHPNEVQAALEVIADTTARFVEAALRAGADGIFYS